jgi:hypothetical protein
MMQVTVLDVPNLLQRYHATSLAMAGAKAPIVEITGEIRPARLNPSLQPLDACYAEAVAIPRGAVTVVHTRHSLDNLKHLSLLVPGS